MRATEDKFRIDFFELCFLAEACIPPAPIARGFFWGKLTDVYYAQLSSAERDSLYDFITREIERRRIIQTGRELGSYAQEQIDIFLARYNPDNQYIVTAKRGGAKEVYRTFKYKNRHHTEINRWVDKAWIVNVEKINESNRK